MKHNGDNEPHAHINVFCVGKIERAVTVDGMSPNQEHTYPASFPYTEIHCTATAYWGFPLNDVQTVFTITHSSYTSVFIHIYLYIYIYEFTNMSILSL